MTVEMELTPRAFKRLFPNASESTYAANFKDHVEGVCDPEPQPDKPSTLERVSEGKEKSPYRAHVSIKRFGVRLLDPDNLAGSCKPILDCLGSCDLLFDDSPEWLELEVTQKQVKRAEIRTEIVITYE